MSFILDALKKIEGQKQKDEEAKAGKLPVMEGGRRWGESRGKLSITLGLIGVLALAALVLAAVALVETYRKDKLITVPEPPSQITGKPSSEDQSGTKGPLPAPPPLTKAPSPSESARSDEQSVVPTPADETEEGGEPVEIEELIETAPPVRLSGPPSSQDSTAESARSKSSAGLPPGAPKLVLQGTSTVDGKPVAVVNFQRVFEGDFIEGVRVIHISDREVELEFEGKRFSLRL